MDENEFAAVIVLETAASGRFRGCILSYSMACLNTLKQEIKTLESVFPKNHERFQVVAASVDELTCRFIGKNGKKYDIHANITVSKSLNYPLLFISCIS